ncbi:MAG: methyltransferase domain-containing protein [Desulfovibrio sp.]
MQIPPFKNQSCTDCTGRAENADIDQVLSDILSKADTDLISQSVKDKFQKVSQSVKGYFSYPTGTEAMLELGYDPDVVHSLGEEVTSFFCGTGNPFLMYEDAGNVRALDVGCGAGIDTFYAARLFGDGSRVCGVDLSADMITRAQNSALAGELSVDFFVGSAEDLPFDTGEFSHVFTNSALNLVVDKGQALSEAFRVLEEGGTLYVVDQILKHGVSISADEIVSSWMN